MEDLLRVGVPKTKADQLQEQAKISPIIEDPKKGYTPIYDEIYDAQSKTESTVQASIKHSQEIEREVSMFRKELRMQKEELKRGGDYIDAVEYMIEETVKAMIVNSADNSFASLKDSTKVAKAKIDYEEFAQMATDFLGIDLDVKELKQFTFLGKEEIEELEKSFNEAPHLREAQKALAKEMTVMIHGEKAYEQAIRLSQALFSGKVADLTKEEIAMGFEGIPQVEVKESIGLIDALVLVKAASSKREARDFINGGGVLINGVQQKDMNFVINDECTIGGEYTIIRRGKKNYYVIKHVK